MRSWLIAVPVLALAACSSNSNGPGNATVPPPSTLTSVSLDGEIALMWGDDSYTANPQLFSNYRVYSATYNLDAGQCGGSWLLEGTTVAPEFVAGALSNGQPLCFAVTGVSVDGIESAQSPVVHDTPRPDARNVLLYARQFSDNGSGFSFWQDLNGDAAVQDSELGLVLPGSSPNADFTVEKDVNGALFLTPARAGVGITAYGSGPVGDLTDITAAPASGYASAGLPAAPGNGYVFQIANPDGFYRYGAVRVTHVGTNLLILDWSYQTDPGNPELLVRRR